jgi:hypothetical protein
MSPWRWTQIKGSKHVAEWNCTINVTELYILSDCEYTVKMYDMNNIKLNYCVFECNKSLKFLDKTYRGWQFTCRNICGACKHTLYLLIILCICWLRLNLVGSVSWRHVNLCRLHTDGQTEGAVLLQAVATAHNCGRRPTRSLAIYILSGNMSTFSADNNAKAQVGPIVETHNDNCMSLAGFWFTLKEWTVNAPQFVRAS